MVEKTGSTGTANGPAGASIVERLVGRNALITGVTGFLGQAVFERLLLDFPDTKVTLLVRPQLGSSGRQRVESLMGRPTFSVLRERVGDEGIAGILADRVDVLDGDLDEFMEAFLRHS